MRTKTSLIFTLLMFLSMVLLSACEAAGGASAGDVGMTASPIAVSSQASPTPTSQPTFYESPTSTDTPQPTLTPTATPDLRLNPDDWENWPIVPTFSARAREIYENGLAMGTDPHAFSKIGDCQTINAAFFGIYAKAGEYSFPQGYDYLEDTIGYYGRNQFGRLSMAVNPGFVASSVLNTLWSDPNACQSGETPLECELRINHPSIVFINMEFWYQGRTPDSYSKYMRQIIEYAISQGAVPVLITKADNVEGDNSINRATAQLAYDYDLPLWNFWRAVQPLPAHGMDTERNDGFHISVAGWNMRSFTGLEVLDAFRKAMADVTPTDTPES
jgi:hypothetical protein